MHPREHWHRSPVPAATSGSTTPGSGRRALGSSTRARRLVVVTAAGGGLQPGTNMVTTTPTNSDRAGFRVVIALLSRWGHTLRVLCPHSTRHGVRRASRRCLRLLYGWRPGTARRLSRGGSPETNLRGEPACHRGERPPGRVQPSVWPANQMVSPVLLGSCGVLVQLASIGSTRAAGESGSTV